MFFLPGPIEFEEADLSALPPQTATPDNERKDFPATLFPVLEKPKKEGGGQLSSVVFVVVARSTKLRTGPQGPLAFKNH